MFVHVVKMGKIDEMREIKNGRTQHCLNSQLFLNNYDIQHENRSIRFMHFYKLTSNALECLFSSFSRHFLLMPGFFLLFFNVILIIIMNMM